MEYLTVYQQKKAPYGRAFITSIEGKGKKAVIEYENSQGSRFSKSVTEFKKGHAYVKGERL